MSTALVTRADVIAKAREFIGTPFMHQARLKGKGIDCVGLLVCSLRELGLPVIDSRSYTRRPDGVTLDRLLAQNATAIDGPAELGDLMEFGMLGPKWPHHVALRTDIGMLHTNGDVGRVLEQSYSAPWPGFFVRAWRLNGVA